MSARKFVEAGASATRDDRTEFQAMITAATSDERPADIILVHSLSRLFRNALHFMQYKELLRRHRVRIVSITQSFGEDRAHLRVETADGVREVQNRRVEITYGPGSGQ